MNLRHYSLRALRYASRFLPRAARSYLRGASGRFSIQKPLVISQHRPCRSFSGRHVVVAGLFSSATGVGKSAELVARTLEQRGSLVTRVDITLAVGQPLSHDADVHLKPSDCDDLDATDVVLVLNPGRTKAVHLFDMAWLLRRCVVAHWIWEIETIPQFWKNEAASYDEIWAPTEFVLHSLRNLLPDFAGHLKVVPFAIDFPLARTPLAEERAVIRDRLGIGRDAFVAGYSFAAGSNYQRKNPEAAAEQFRAAFPPDDRSVILILRCRDLSHHKAERHELLRAVARDPRIILVDDRNPISIDDFYAAIDLYLSPSRAEGFGLNLVEASQLGIPVITSGWRLAPEIAALPHIHQVDFDLVPVVDPQGQYRNIKGARWSEPRLMSVVTQLRLLRQKHRAPNQNS